MMRTEPELYEVAGAQNNHLWLEVLEGQDQGLRVSVPVISSDYDEETQTDIQNLETGGVYQLVLESEDASPPDWRVEEVCDQVEVLHA